MKRILLLRWSLAVVLTIFHYNNDIMLIGVVRIWVFTPFVEIEWGFFIFKIQLKTYINIFLKTPHKPLESLINIILYVLEYVRVFEWIWSKDILKCNFFSPTLTTTTTTPNRSLDDWTTKNFQSRLCEPVCSFPNQDFEVLQNKSISSAFFITILLPVVLCKHAKNTKTTKMNHPVPSLCCMWISSYFCFATKKPKPPKDSARNDPQNELNLGWDTNLRFRDLIQQKIY